MSDRENVISGLQYTVEMFLFDPLTGHSKDPDDLNAADRITYDACIGAIALLKEQEAVEPSFNERMKHFVCRNCSLVLDEGRDFYCPSCGKQIAWDEYYIHKDDSSCN